MHKSFALWWSSIYLFFLLVPVLLVSHPTSQSFSPMFLSKSFTVLALAFRPLIHFELTFVHGVRLGSKFSYWALDFFFFFSHPGWLHWVGWQEVGKSWVGLALTIPSGWPGSLSSGPGHGWTCALPGAAQACVLLDWRGSQPGVSWHPLSGGPPILSGFTARPACETGCLCVSVCWSVPMLHLRKPPPAPFSLFASAIPDSVCLLLGAGHPHCLPSHPGTNLCPEATT